MSQYTINIGALPNDGTGDPLRTAFNETNLNFDQVFAAGPVLSNIQIANNSILTTNTNGNLVLVPNGIGIVQANASIVPNMANIRNLGSSTQRWATVYTQYLDASQFNLSGDLTVGGNLTVNGNIIEMGNIVTDALTIQLANTATTANSANGSGITVGADDNIATILYNSTANAWTTNVGISTTGNIIAGNISAADGNTSIQINIDGFLGAAPGFSFSGNTLYAPTAAFAGFGNVGTNGLFVGLPLFTPLGSNIATQITSNVASYSQINQQNTSSSNVASGDYIITADNGTDTTHFLDIGLTSSTWDGSQDNSLGNSLGPNDGYFYVQDGNLTIGTSVTDDGTYVWKFDTTGNLTSSGNIITTGNIIAGNIGAPDGNTSVVINRAGILGASPGFSYDYAGNILYSPAGSFAGDASGSNGLFVGYPVFTELGSSVMGQFTGNVDAYTQINIQNINSGSSASGDFIVTADNGNDSENFVDLGIASSNYAYTSYPAYGPNDAYLLNNGANLLINVQSPDKVIKFLVGGSANSDVVATMSNIGIDVNGNIIPTTSNVYSLGNSTNQWSDLYVSNSTIYMNNVPITLGAGNVLTVDGNAVLTNDSNTSITTTGNITADYFIGDGSQLINLPIDATKIENGTSSIDIPTANSNIYIGVDGIGSTEFTIAGINTLNLSALGNISASSNISATNGTFTTAVTARNLNADGGNISLNPDFGLIFTQSNAVITANTQSWTFDTSGNLTLPADGFLRVTSGIVGTGASPAPSLSGFSTLSAVTANISGNVTGGNLISNNGVYANVDLIVGDRANALASKGRFVSNSGFMYLQVGNGTPDSTGNIVFSPYQSSTARVTVDTDSGNITAVGNVSAGNISGGNIITAGRVLASGNILGLNFATEGSVQASSVQATGNVSAGLYGQLGYNSDLGAWGLEATEGFYDVSLTAGDTTKYTALLNGDGVFYLPETVSANVARLSSEINNADVDLVLVGGKDVRIESDGTSTNKTWTFDASGDLTAPGNITTTGNISGNTAGYAIGYRDIPQISFTGNTTIDTIDAGKHFYSTESTNYVLTIANNASQGFQVGAAITIVNQGSGTITVAEGSGVTLYLAGNVTAGNRSVATFGMATLIKVATDTWFINGTGVS